MRVGMARPAEGGMSVERLTKRELLAGHHVAFVSGEDCFDVWSVPKKFMGNAIDRLAAIEDILGDTYDLEHLRELVEADKAGRCVVMPCKVGDKIYKLFCGGAVEIEVERIVCWSNGCWKINAHTNRKYTDWKGFEIDFSDFGKTVFLTREAAEAALAKEAK